MPDETRHSDQFADSLGWASGGTPQPDVAAPGWWRHIERHDLPADSSDLGYWAVDDDVPFIAPALPPIEGLPSRRTAWTVNLAVLLAVFTAIALVVDLASAGTAAQAALVACPVTLAVVFTWVAVRRR